MATLISRRASVWLCIYTALFVYTLFTDSIPTADVSTGNMSKWLFGMDQNTGTGETLPPV